MTSAPGLPSEGVQLAYPHELSGGLRQRAMVTMALSCNPRLLLADEPTTALDATVQALILLRRLQRKRRMGMILATHDLGVAAEITDTVAVMYAGRIVESGSVAALLGVPTPLPGAACLDGDHGRLRRPPRDGNLIRSMGRALADAAD